MTLKLVVTTNVNGDVFELILKNAKYGVGRRHENDLRIKETYISGFHAELVRTENGDYALSDLGSSNGTFLNGIRVESKEVVKSGDFIKFGILKVAVQEHTGLMPKIVALKDRPAFAKKDVSNTAAISVERKTGPIGSAEAISAKSATRPATTEAKDDSLVQELEEERRLVADARKEAEAHAEVVSKLEVEVAFVRRELASREERCKELEEKERAAESVKSELETLRATLSESRKTVATLENDLKSSLEGSRKKIAVLDADKKKLSQLDGEVASLRSRLSRSEEESRSAREQLAATLEGRDETIRRLTSELDAVRGALEENQARLAAAAKETADVASLRENLTSLESRLVEACSLAESSEEKQGQLKSELLKLQAKADSEKEAATRAKELERANTKLAKSCESLSAKAAEQAIHLATARESLKERERELLAARSEGKKAGKMSEKLASADAELAALRASLETFASRQSRLEEESKESELRAQSLEDMLRDAESAKERLTADLAEEKVIAESGRAELEKLKVESERSRREREVLESGNTDLRDQVKLRVGELQSAKAEANELRVELRKLRESSEAALSETDTTLNAKISDLESALDSEKAKAIEASERNGSLSAELTKLRKSLDQVRGESDQLKVRYEESARSNGRLQAELNRESAERERISSEADSARARAKQLVEELRDLKGVIETKDRELAEKDQLHSRSESEAVRNLKRELSEAQSGRNLADEKAEKAVCDKQTLSGAFERLKSQYDQAEASIRKAKETEVELHHGKGILALRLEKAEASNSELAARIKEDALAAVASRSLIEKLEVQIRDNESEAVCREREQVVALQADLNRWKHRSSEGERTLGGLEAELVRSKEAKESAEGHLLELKERILELESESKTTRALLAETEAVRGDLSSRLALESALVESHAKEVSDLRENLSATISRYQGAEREQIARHGEEVDKLLDVIRDERGRREGLEAELDHTRVGMSEALRRVREDSEAAQAKLLAERNAKLSAMEEELSEAIRSREEIEASRNEFEDELNQRDGRIEALSERLEDFTLLMEDEIEARQKVEKELETVRDGFSRALRATWGRLGTTRDFLDEESSAREKAEAALSEATQKIEELVAVAEDREKLHEATLQDWEERFNALRGEKITLASEDATLQRIRAEIAEAGAKRYEAEGELEKLVSGLKDFNRRHREMQDQSDSLLKEREKLKAELNSAKSEMKHAQQRCAEAAEQESKLSTSISAAERRIQSLRKLESEMEQAVQRRRQQNILSRGDVFAEQLEATSSNGGGDFSQEEFYKKLIAKLDLIDDLAKRYDNKWRYPRVAEQLAILKRSFIEFLHDHSVREFDLEPGTVLSVAERKRIKLVPLQTGVAKKTASNGNGSNGHSTHVVETLRPGFVYKNGGQDVIIRKAEVLVS